MFEYTIEVLKYELINCEYKRDYPSMMAVSMSESLEKKISELQQAIAVLERDGK